MTPERAELLKRVLARVALLSDDALGALDRLVELELAEMPPEAEA
jgi:hypothetical protein